MRKKSKKQSLKGMKRKYTRRRKYSKRKRSKRSKRSKRGGSMSALLARHGAGGHYPLAPSYSIKECQQLQKDAETRRLEAIGMASQPRSAYSSHGCNPLIDPKSGDMYYISPEGKHTWANPGAHVSRIEESEMEQERRWTREEAAAAEERHRLWKASEMAMVAADLKAASTENLSNKPILRREAAQPHALGRPVPNVMQEGCVVDRAKEKGSSVAMPTSRRPPTGKEPILLNRKRKRPRK